MVTFIIFIIILGLLVFVHELGHFLTAKAIGVRVNEFAFGFKPRLWSKKIGETEYAINAIPLGGYVRMEGEDEKAGKRSFLAQKPGKRMLVLLAGVVMNAVLAWVLITIVYIVGTIPLSATLASHNGVEKVGTITISEVKANSPAQKAGIVANDKIVKINGAGNELSSDLISSLKSHPGQPIVLNIDHNGTTRSVTIAPRVNPPAGEGALGIVMLDNVIVKAPWYKAPFIAIEELGSEIKATVVGFGGFIADLFISHKVNQNVSGIVGVGVATGVVRQLGLAALIQFVALISINLAVVNLFPILPLDGGHVLTTIIEMVTKKPVPDWLKEKSAMIGLALIALLFVVVTYHDIINFDVLARIKSVF